jgi:8-oxo-dGTP diphosphatase
MYQYVYPRPSVTADVVLIAKPNADAHVLLVQRAFEPFEGSWALPGGFVDDHEDLADTAARELFEETGVKSIALKQIGAFGKPGRDPRGHTITIGFCGVVNEKSQLRAGDDAKQARWFPIKQLPTLAFDHDEILETALLSICLLFPDAVLQND